MKGIHPPPSSSSVIVLRRRPPSSFSAVGCYAVGCTAVHPTVPGSTAAVAMPVAFAPCMGALCRPNPPLLSENQRDRLPRQPLRRSYLRRKTRAAPPPTHAAELLNSFNANVDA